MGIRWQLTAVTAAAIAAFTLAELATAAPAGQARAGQVPAGQAPAAQGLAAARCVPGPKPKPQPCVPRHKHPIKRPHKPRKKAQCKYFSTIYTGLHQDFTARCDVAFDAMTIDYPNAAGEVPTQATVTTIHGMTRMAGSCSPQHPNASTVIRCTGFNAGPTDNVDIPIYYPPPGRGAAKDDIETVTLSSHVIIIDRSKVRVGKN